MQVITSDLAIKAYDTRIYVENPTGGKRHERSKKFLKLLAKFSWSTSSAWIFMIWILESQYRIFRDQSPTHLIAISHAFDRYQRSSRCRNMVSTLRENFQAHRSMHLIKYLMEMKYKLLKSKLSLELQIINLAASLFHCFPFGTTMLVFRCCRNVSLHWIF